jgi:hypothetical protein
VSPDAPSLPCRRHLTTSNRVQRKYGPTDYTAFVTDALAKSTGQTTGKSVNQKVLRRCLGLSSSYLLTDTSTNPVNGLNTWSIGFNRLVDVVVALHARKELELETMNEASKACSECWSVSGSWAGLAEGRTVVRSIAIRLKRLLDENGRTYRGERVYAPG